ncbi:hypothetical protein E2H86_00620 [Pseudomonas putida]|uniref:hypothetical protein n=1 Tax=Pseudomonas putida TaxID=303 RepID=UPI0010596A34|nr:hypothetical protein [Pseudomonas putida]TDJ79146.1 hypothetical protein E2H86_00620 [Pseudomonas putida]
MRLHAQASNAWQKTDCLPGALSQKVAPASCEDLDDGEANAAVVEAARLITHARKAKMHLFCVYDQAALLRHSEHYSLAEIPSYEFLASEFKRFVAQLGTPNVHHQWLTLNRGSFFYRFDRS